MVPPAEAVPEADRAERRSVLAETSLEMARRRCRVAKFLLPSCLEVGLAFNSSKLGGPLGWRRGWVPLACPGAKVAVIGVEGSWLRFGSDVLGASTISMLLTEVQVDRELAFR